MVVEDKTQTILVEEHNMKGRTEIYVSGREYKVPGELVTYKQIVEIWNKLHEAENKHIIGTPGIDYEDDLKGEIGVLLPGKEVRVKDGTSFSVDPEHVLVRIASPYSVSRKGLGSGTPLALSVLRVFLVSLQTGLWAPAPLKRPTTPPAGSRTTS